MLLLDTLFLNVILVAISMIALFEMLTATGCMQFKGLSLLAFIPSAVLPFYHIPFVESIWPLVVGGHFLLFFVILIRGFPKIRVEQASMIFLFSLLLPLCFSCGVLLRDNNGAAAGGLYILLALGSAWLCDSGAFFVGSRFGKTKLAPVISPKKTVEGAIGGVIATVIFMALVAWGYQALWASLGTVIVVNYPAMLFLTPLFAIMGMLGDLSASVIKRQFNVKDFGNLMPGHGGILDRFDSTLFTLPAVYLFSHYITIVR